MDTKAGEKQVENKDEWQSTKGTQFVGKTTTATTIKRHDYAILSVTRRILLTVLTSTVDVLVTSTEYSRSNLFFSKISANLKHTI